MPAKMEKVLDGEKLVTNGFSSSIVRSESDAAHVRTSAFSRDDFNEWK